MDTIKELLDNVTPSLGRLGLVSIKNQEKISADIHTYYSSLNEYSHEIQTTIKELKDALVEGDSKKLEEFSMKTKKLVQKVSAYVKKVNK